MAAAKPVYILLGPNLNMLGMREPQTYGHETLKDIEKMCAVEGKKLGLTTTLKQSNHEGDLVGWVQDAMTKSSGLIINAGAYTHTSIAIHDALRMLTVPIYEVHHSNIFAREEFRHHSYIAPVARGVICGLGAAGYLAALQHLAKTVKSTR
jgi:3-dehydroquinate dehydratase II